MRTAEDILMEEYGKLIMNPEKVYLQNPSIIKAAHTAINEARIEAIWECVNSATQMWNKREFDRYKLAWDLIDQIDPTKNQVRSRLNLNTTHSTPNTKDL